MQGPVIDNYCRFSGLNGVYREAVLNFRNSQNHQNLCPHGQGQGVLDKMRTGGGKRGGGQKVPKLCGHPLWMTPKNISKEDIKIYFYSLNNV